MKILLYFEGEKILAKSGIGRALDHQKRALSEVGIEYTLDADCSDYDILHINTYGVNSHRMVRKARKLGKKVIYHAHSLFLIPPETPHCFTIDTHSEYIFIRFVLHYVEDYIGKYLAEIFRDSSRQAEISLNKSDENMVFQLFDFIRKEEDNRQMGTNYLQQQWLNSILVLVARNIVHEAKDECLSVKYLTINETNPAVYMLQYIQQHIHQPELLRAESLSKIFHLSPDYIGIYFKRYYQETLQQYIGRNRLKMVENLLLNSSMTVKEIAYKMGYTDSCYLVKSFQKVYGISSLKYRQEHSQSNNLK